MGEVVGSYKGTSVKIISKTHFETERLTDSEHIYAVVDGSTQIPLVKAGKIIGIMNPQGDVDDCRIKAYKFPVYESPAETRNETVTTPSIGGDIDIDKFIRDSLAVDLLDGWAKAMGVEETTEKKPTYDFV